MTAIIHPYRRKTSSICPVCQSPMQLIYWRDGSTSLMCMKCHFGFNYKSITE